MALLNETQSYRSANDGTTNAYLFKIDTTFNSNNISNNTSNVTINLKAYGNKANYSGNNLPKGYLDLYDNNTNSWSRKVDGVTVSSIPRNSWVTIGTWTGNVTHNDDGTLKIITRGIYNSNSNTSYLPDNGEETLLSPTLTLTTIPRKTNISTFGVIFGTTNNYICEPLSSDFRHKIKITLGTWTYTSDYFLNSTTITLPTNLFDQKPDDRVFQGTQILYTYDGTTLIGSNSDYFNVNLLSTDANPVIGDTEVYDTNSISLNLTKNKYILVSNLSKIYAKVEYAIPYSGNLKSATINNSNALQGDGFIYLENLSATSNYNYEITSTRIGTYSSGNIETQEIVPYFAPYITAKWKRENPTDNKISFNLTGKFFNDVFGSNSGAVQNEFKTIYFRHKANSNATWSDWIAFEDFINGTLVENSDGTFSVTNGETIDDFNYQNQVIFQIKFGDTAQDILSQEFLVTKGISSIAIGKNKIKFGVPVYDKNNNEIVGGLSLLTQAYFSFSSTGSSIIDGTTFTLANADFNPKINYKVSGDSSLVANNSGTFLIKNLHKIKMVEITINWGGAFERGLWTLSGNGNDLPEGVTMDVDEKLIYIVNPNNSGNATEFGTIQQVRRYYVDTDSTTDTFFADPLCSAYGGTYYPRQGGVSANASIKIYG